MCLSVIIFDQECYGCGMTRACMHAMHGEVSAAWAFNPLVAIVLPLLVFGLFMEVKGTWRKLKAAQSRPEHANENAA